MMLSMLPVMDMPVFAEDPIWQINENSGWTAAYPENDQNDYLKDQQTGSGSVSQDIVGDADYPSTYIHFTNDEVAFRIRVSNVDGGTDTNYQFKNFTFVGIDADVNGSIDFFLGVYNPTGNNGRLGIYRSSVGYANTSPSTTGISGKPLLAYKPVRNVNYSITQTGDGSNFNNDADYFISYKFSVADISSALAGMGYSFSASTPFCFMTGTAAQDNSFNQDINGMDRTGWSSGRTWSSLGVFSDVMTTNGSIAYYTVTFDKNTGDTEASPAVKLVQAGGNSLGSLPISPTKRGMYFQEWNTMPDGAGETITANTVIDSNITAYAIWSDKQVFTVTFNPNNGNWSGSTNPITVSTINGVVGDNMPPPPSQSNKYFMGWNTTSNGNGSWFNSATAVTGSIPVYAQWANNANKSAVFYNNFTPDGGSIIASIYSNGNSNNFNGTLPIITRSGYNFGGWYLNDKTCSGTAVTGISQEGSYYAKWTAATYTATFNGNGGSDTVNYVPLNKTITSGLFGDMPTPEPTRAGYQFIEWNRNPAGTGEAIYPTSVILGDITIYAIWKSSRMVTFHANGGKLMNADGNEVDTQLVNAVDGSLEYFPQPPYRGDYTFLGWGTSADTTTVVDIRNVSAYTDLYAIWSPVYNVIFYANNGNWGGAPAVTETNVVTAYGSVLYIPDAPTRTNYTFSGWNTKADGSGTAFTMSTPVNDYNTNVYAMWTPVAGAHTVRFETNGGSDVEDMTTYQIDTMPVSTKTGYVLEGWYTDSGLSEADKISFPYAVSADTILYAKWTANTYSVTLNDNGGSGGSSSVTAAYDQHMPSAAKPSREGYTFIGYFDQSTGGVKYYNSNMSSAKKWNKTGANDILYAHWEANTYTVTFDTNGGQFSGGTTTIDIDQTYNSKYILPSEIPTRSSYTFSSWNMQDDGSGITITENIDVTLTVAQAVYAVWTEEGYVTINYAANNSYYGTVSRDTESLNPETEDPEGSEATANTGYEFVCWEDEDGNMVSTDASFIPEKGSGGKYASANYIAVFAPDTDTAYTVEHYVMDSDGTYPEDATKIDSNTGTTDDTLTLKNLADGSLTVEDAITYAYGEVDGTKTTGTIINPDGSLVIKLYYDRSQYVLTLGAGTGTSNATGGGTYYYEQEVNITVTVDSGYTWDKWESSNTALLADQEDQSTSFLMPAGAVSLTAKTIAQEGSYNITYSLGGGAAVPPNRTTYTAEDEAFTLTNPTKEGYTFTGWTGTGLEEVTMTVTVETGSTGNRSYTATWEARTYTVILNDNGGGGGSGSVTAIYDQPMPSAAKPARDAYTFAGYYDAPTGGTKYYNADMSSAKNWNKTDSNVTLFARWTAYDVTGTVVEEENPSQSIVGATVMIMKGNTRYGDIVTTDSEGEFSIRNIPAGTYNLIITVGEKTKIILITVEEGVPVTQVGIIVFPSNNASSVLTLQGSGTPAVVVGNLHPEAEDYFEEEHSTGFVKVEMTVVKTDEETANSNGNTNTLNAISRIKTQAQSAGATIGLYLDMNIEKYQRFDEALPWDFKGNITRTNGLIQVIIPIPSELQGKSSYTVYRYHENTVNIISTAPNGYGEYLTLDTSDWTLTLYVRNFSVYAIAYYARQSSSGGGGGGGGTPHYVITFRGDGSTPSSVTQSVAYGGLLKKPADPARSGYSFAGWYKADGSEWNFSTDRVYTSITLTAKWIEVNQNTVKPALDKENHFAYMQGYPDKTFGPGMNMSRAEAAVMFARLLVNKMDVDRTYPNSFKDIDGTKWYANAIGYMEQYGIIKGYTDGTFKPETPISRAEFAAIAARFDTLVTGEPNIFSDVAETYWARDYISFATDKGWIKGYLDGTFKPGNNITRAEVVALVNRVLERYYDKSYADTNAKVLKQYMDLAPGYWAFYDIVEASNMHNYGKTSNNETWLNVTK